ncbi:MAG: EF-hand domain-containing protein [Planctomycetes bacterium]|nr:EF-hand domain-containing protein [Planctomycetota bacterium]
MSWKRLISFAAAAALLVSLGRTAYADDPKPEGDNPPPSQGDDKGGEAKDGDHKGGERGRPGDKSPEEAWAEALKKFDKDGDGKISVEEWKTWRDEVNKEHSDPDKAPEFLRKRFDKNGDGKLDDAEKAGLKEEMAAYNERMNKMHEEGWTKCAKDGLLDKDGFIALRKAIGEMLRKGREGRGRGPGGGGPGGGRRGDKGGDDKNGGDHEGDAGEGAKEGDK